MTEHGDQSGYSETAHSAINQLEEIFCFFGFLFYQIQLKKDLVFFEILTQNGTYAEKLLLRYFPKYLKLVTVEIYHHNFVNMFSVFVSINELMESFHWNFDCKMVVVDLLETLL